MINLQRVWSAKTMSIGDNRREEELSLPERANFLEGVIRF
jgi:hypothetical protein